MEEKRAADVEVRAKTKAAAEAKAMAARAEKESEKAKAAAAVYGGGGEEDEEEEEDPYDDAAVIRKISSQVFKGLSNVHKRKIVHRDVKGANLILSEKDGGFKLIDFGVACEVSGKKVNYREDLQPHDPSYCPPEAVPAEGGLVLSAGGAFDVYSAALLMIQMLFPNTRDDQAIKRFKSTLDVFEYDLDAWRESLQGVSQYARGFEILDAFDGWEVLKGCLKAEPGKRMSAQKAAGSRWCSGK